MANQAVRLWEGVLDSLNGLATGDNSRMRVVLFQGVKELLGKIDRSPQQPKAWKRLVKDMQVRGPAHSHAGQYV